MTENVDQAERRQADREKAVSALEEMVAVPPPGSERSPGQMAWRSFRRHPPAMVGLSIVVLLALASLLAPLLTPYDAERTNLDAMLEPPSWKHVMGTDELGRDLLTRLLYGGRVSLSIGVLAMLLAVVIGSIVGGVVLLAAVFASSCEGFC